MWQSPYAATLYEREASTSRMQPLLFHAIFPALSYRKFILRHLHEHVNRFKNV